MAKPWGPGNPLYDWKQKHRGKGKGPRHDAEKITRESLGYPPKRRPGHMKKTYHRAKHYGKMHLAQVGFFLLGMIPTIVKFYDGWKAQGFMGAIGNTIYGWTGIKLDTNQNQWTYAGWDYKGLMYGLAPAAICTGIGWGVSKLATKSGVNKAMPKGWGI